MKNIQKVNYTPSLFMIFRKEKLFLFCSYTGTMASHIELIFVIFLYNLHTKFTLIFYAQSVYRRISKYYARSRTASSEVWL